MTDEILSESLGGLGREECSVGEGDQETAAPPEASMT